jgi:acetyltransferase-like isoleucine patch superfamily enzyme
MSESPTPASDPVPAEGRRQLPVRLKAAWDLEFAHFRWRLLIGLQLARLLPEGRAVNLRTNLLRAIGPRVGAGTRVLGMPKIQWSPPGPPGQRLRIGVDCTIGAHTILEFGELLTIGDRVSLADGVVILTTTHELGPRQQRAGPAVRNPVHIGNDVEIGARSIVLPGATIGDGARILPDSVVTASVPAGATVSGIPARVLRSSSAP